jgi:glycerol uptake facilitator-like aquaporin
VHRGSHRREHHVLQRCRQYRPAPPHQPAHLWAEIIATAGLVLLIFALVRTHRVALAPAAVGTYIAAAYFFTSSTSFANPAISIGRMFSNTFAGIAPASVPAFIVAQIVGGAVGLLGVHLLYPTPTAVKVPA